MNLNKKKLMSLITLNGDTCETLSEVMGITPQTFSNKINEKHQRGFTQPEIMFIKIRYNLSADDIDLIFFSENVSKKDTMENVNE